MSVVARSIEQKSCPSGCCKIQSCQYVDSNNYSYDVRHKYGKYKGGVFFYDPENNRTLLVQSRGRKWGAPKGTMEDGDISIEACALREVEEETGIKLHYSDLGRYYKIDRTTYYYVEYKCSDDMQPQILEGENNDANGISWLRPECVVNMYKNGTFDLNSHCKKLFNRFLNIDVNSV